MKDEYLRNIFILHLWHSNHFIMQKLNFAIIGAGNIAPIHATAIKNIDDAELAAIVTRNAERGRAFVDQYGGKWCADYRDVLSDQSIDVVTICTPHDLHAPMAIEAARAGKHVLVEKPMAISTAECDAMIDACEQAGVTLGVVFQMRFDPLAQKLKSLINAGKLGRLLWNTTTALWYRTDEYYRSSAWRGTWAHEGGGVLINQGVHVIDLMLYLTGMPTRVVAQTRTLNHSIQVEDGALAILEYPDNRLGLIQATVATYPGYPERLEIAGTNGSAIYHRGQARLEWHLQNPHEDGELQAEISSGASAPMNINASGHTMQFQNFADAVRHHTTPLVDGREGRKSIAVIEAIYRSSRENRQIEIRARSLETGAW
jgi:predicted dehydrogenase